MAERSPAFQFYPGDFLGSPSVMMMTAEQVGAYVLLLCCCWQDGDCGIPDDDRALAILSRLGARWSEVGAAVREKFVTHPKVSTKLTNVRLLTERRKQERWKEKCAKGGKKSAKERASKAALDAASDGAKGSSRVVDLPLQLKGNSSSSSSSSFSSSSSSSSPSSPSDLDANASCPPDESGDRRAPPKKPKIAPAPVTEIISIAEGLGIPVALKRDGSPDPDLVRKIERVWAASADHRSFDWWRDYLTTAYQNDFLAGRKTDFQASLGWLLGVKNMLRVKLEFLPTRQATGPPVPKFGTKTQQMLNAAQAFLNRTGGDGGDGG